MSNDISTSTSNIYIGTAIGSMSGGSIGTPCCATHGWAYCNCSVSGNMSQCTSCGALYSPQTLHVCSYYIFTNPTWITSTTTGTSGLPWTQLSPLYRKIKEITTDSELIYTWNGSSFNMKLPTKFSDCFLKVGFAWSPLYPLIFSAYENDSKELSFHLVIGIAEKVFEGDKVILKSVTTTKIEDNLTLMQLTQRISQYFEDK